MTIPLKQPQEIEVWYVLPAVRRELVLALQEQGLNQKAIAQLLNITEPAVSQYCNDKRGKEITFTPIVKSYIKQSAQKITNPQSAYHQIQQITYFMKETKALCKIHMAIESGLQGCDLCYK
ncbi:MAG: helix-turn-helix domain-containing protein [Nanoarchaeota archaeon]|nr:helix-turn-helix domain-containing protein [Nanoarchaeota archaeon]